MRVAVVGSRNFKGAYVRVHRLLLKLEGLYGDDLVVVSGGSGVVDHTVLTDCIDLGITVLTFPAKWKKYGKGAGLKRNTKIVKNVEKVYAFWDGKSPGTADVIRKAQIANKPVVIRREEKK